MYSNTVYCIVQWPWSTNFRKHHDNMNLSCVTYSFAKDCLAFIEQRVLSPQHIAYVCISAFAGRVEWISPVGGGVRRWLVAPTSPHTAPPGRRDSPLSSRSCRPTGRVSSQRVQHHQIGWSYWVMLCGLSFRLYNLLYSTKSWEHRTWSVWVKFYQLSCGSFH